ALCGRLVMPSESTQQKLSRIRAPRVHLTYEVEVGGAIQMKELPFVVGVLSDLSGKPDEPLPRLKDRKFVEIDRDNLDKVLAAKAKPRARRPNPMSAAEQSAKAASAATTTQEGGLLDKIIAEGRLGRDAEQKAFARDLIGEFVNQVMDGQMKVSHDTIAMIN